MDTSTSCYKSGANEMDNEERLFAQVESDAFNNAELKKAAKENSLNDFLEIFSKKFEEIFIARMERNKKLFDRFQNDKEFKTSLLSRMVSRKIASVA